MFALIVGIIFGVIVAIPVGILFSEIYGACFSRKSEKIVSVAGIAACLIVLIGIPTACVNYDIHCYKRWTNEYKIQKETIESSLRSEKI